MIFCAGVFSSLEGSSVLQAIFDRHALSLRNSINTTIFSPSLFARSIIYFVLLSADLFALPECYRGSTFLYIGITLSDYIIADRQGICKMECCTKYKICFCANYKNAPQKDKIC